MENVYQEKSRFRMTKRKALILGFAILATGIILAEPIYASVPWYITTIGAVAGGIVGTLTGSPLGTIAGATAGALLADYLYQITHKDSGMPSYFPNQQKLENEFASSYENLTTQEMINDANIGQTTLSLFASDYYFNAQQQEAIVPYYLNQSTLSEFNISLASGTYATLNNVSNSLFAPVDTVLWQTFFDGSTSNNNGFTTNQTGQTYALTYEGNKNEFAFTGLEIFGSQLAIGNHMFVEPQNTSTSIFKFNEGLAYLNITNSYTGKTYNISAKGVLPLNTSKIPYGFYLINHVSNNLLTSGIQVLPNGEIDTSLSSGRTGTYYYSTTGYELSIAPNMILVNESEFSSSTTQIIVAGNAVLTSGDYSGTSKQDCNLFQPQTTFNGLSNYYTSLSSDLQNIYSSAQSYFSVLRSEGFTNINQLPPNDVIPFPSDTVPSSMLNQSFNYQQLLEMYYAYMNDLNNTFHNSTLFNGKNFTKFVNQTEFVNGFLTEYGNLTYTVGTVNHYVNYTDFFIQTYTHKLFFAKGHTTNLTGEIYPVLVLNGSQNGSLLYVDASIYVINLQLAGKNISSYTLEPEQITYVLPNTTNIGVPNTSGFLTSTSNFLEKYYLILTVIITIAVIGYVYTRKQKGSGKE